MKDLRHPRPWYFEYGPHPSGLTMRTWILSRVLICLGHAFHNCRRRHLARKLLQRDGSSWWCECAVLPPHNESIPKNRSNDSQKQSNCPNVPSPILNKTHVASRKVAAHSDLTLEITREGRRHASRPNICLARAHHGSLIVRVSTSFSSCNANPDYNPN